MKKEIALLLRKFLLGKSSPEEDRQLDTWYGKPSRPHIRLSYAEWQEIKDRIWNSITARTQKPVTRPLYIRICYPRYGTSLYRSYRIDKNAGIGNEFQYQILPFEETATRLFSGTFAAGKDLSHILWAVEYSMDVRIERPAENEIIITNNKY